MKKNKLVIVHVPITKISASKKLLCKISKMFKKAIGRKDISVVALPVSSQSQYMVEVLPLD